MADNNVVNNGKDGAGQSTEDVCRDYLRNVCYRGKTCKYLHPDINEDFDLCWGTTPWPLSAIQYRDQMRMCETHYPGIPVFEQKLEQMNSTVPETQPLSCIKGMEQLNNCQKNTIN